MSSELRVVIVELSITKDVSLDTCQSTAETKKMMMSEGKREKAKFRWYEVMALTNK